MSRRQILTGWLFVLTVRLILQFSESLGADGRDYETMQQIVFPDGRD